MVAMTASRRIGKTGVRDRARAPEPPIGWPDVLRALPDDETRSYAVRAFREEGFTADAFAHRRAARDAMAEALTATEDWLEATHPRRDQDRTGLRIVRRRLERELWP